MAYKVFISYSHTNSAEIRALVAELNKIEGLCVLYDKNRIHPGDKIHQTISDLIYESDCVVALLTKEGLESDEVKAEIVLSADRRKKIIPIVDKELIARLPLFIDELNHIPYDKKDFDSMLKEVISELTSRCKKYLQETDLDHYLNRVIEKVLHESPYRGIDPSLRFLDDPRQVYIEPKCITFPWDMKSKFTSSVKCFVEGSDDYRHPALILGNYGVGKSSFVYKYIIDHASTPNQKNNVRIPIFYPLRQLDSKDGDNIPIIDRLRIDTESDYGTFWKKNKFSEMLRAGRLLVVLDGIDEIPNIQTHGDPLEYLSDFRKIIDEGHNQLIVTSRLGLFSGQVGEIERLGWYQCKIQPWSDEDIKQYLSKSQAALQKYSPEEQKYSPEEFVDKIFKTSNLAKLAKTPLYAWMMLTASDEIMHLDGETITVTSLYNMFTEKYFEANWNRSIFKERIESKIRCLEIVAWYMYSNHEKMTRCEDLREVLDRELLGGDTSTLLKFLDTELRVYSLMIPDYGGKVRFSHDSLHSYFAARYLYNGLQSRRSQLSRLFEKNRITRDIIKFLADMLPDKQEIVDELCNHLSNSKSPEAKHFLVLLTLEMKSSLDSMNLDNVKLSGEDLFDIRANCATIENSYLIDTILKGAKFQNTSFRHADLSGAYVDGANFRDCDMSMAIVKNLKAERSPWFSGAIFDNAIMSSKDLDRIKGWLCLERSCFSNRKDDIQKTEDSLKKAEILD